MRRGGVWGIVYRGPGGDPKWGAESGLVGRFGLGGCSRANRDDIVDVDDAFNEGHKMRYVLVLFDYKVVDGFLEANPDG